MFENLEGMDIRLRWKSPKFCIKFIFLYKTNWSFLKFSVTPHILLYPTFENVMSHMFFFHNFCYVKITIWAIKLDTLFSATNWISYVHVESHRQHRHLKLIYDIIYFLKRFWHFSFSFDISYSHFQTFIIEFIGRNTDSINEIWDWQKYITL